LRFPLARAVVVAWVILLLSGRWRSEPSWIDRLGRALGVFWIVWAVLEGVRPAWFPF
jgi:hypothetical protein